MPLFLPSFPLSPLPHIMLSFLLCLMFCLLSYLPLPSHLFHTQPLKLSHLLLELCIQVVFHVFWRGGRWQSEAKSLSEICSLLKPYIGENLDQAKDLPTGLKASRTWPWEGGTVKSHSWMAWKHRNTETWKPILSGTQNPELGNQNLFLFLKSHLTLDPYS